MCADTFVNFSAGDMMLNADNKVTIYVDQNDCKGVLTAAKNLATDIKNVCGSATDIVTNSSNARIIAGTIGHSQAIDKL